MLNNVPALPRATADGPAEGGSAADSFDRRVWRLGCALWCCTTGSYITALSSDLVHVRAPRFRCILRAPLAVDWWRLLLAQLVPPMQFKTCTAHHASLREAQVMTLMGLSAQFETTGLVGELMTLFEPQVVKARSHCRFVLPLIHFIPDLLTYTVHLFLKRQCD